MTYRSAACGRSLPDAPADAVARRCWALAPSSTTTTTTITTTTTTSTTTTTTLNLYHRGVLRSSKIVTFLGVRILREESSSGLFSNSVINGCYSFRDGDFKVRNYSRRIVARRHIFFV